MKVLFFYVDNNVSSGYSTGLGLASISGYLKIHGIKTELVYYRTNYDLKYAIDKIGATSPDIIGFNSPSVNWRTVDMLSCVIKKRFPHIFQIYGGIHATLTPETLSTIESLDAVCVGYGEVPMLELAKRIVDKKITNIPGLWIKEKKNGKESIIKNTPYFQELNQDNFINFDHGIFLKELSRFNDFDIDSYSLDIIFNRGCPFSCAFCCNKRLNEIHRNRVFTPSPSASIEALKKSIMNTGLKFVNIHDDILTLNKKWFKEFIGKYAEEVHLPFSCSLRAGCFDDNDAILLKKAGIQSAWIGVESGNDYIRNKVMKKGLSRKQIIDSISLLHRHKIALKTQNIIGAPNETAERFIDTVKINAECWPAQDYMLSIFYPYPTTDLFDICGYENLFSNRNEPITERVSTALELPYFSSKKILFYFRNFKNLIAYQHLRIKYPVIFFLELTDKTSLVLSILVKCLGMPKAFCKMLFLMLPFRVRRWVTGLRHRFYFLCKD